ncbi:MAG: NfeD family protein [Prevotella sp.]|jgi:membrane protein implicated in regulation of membrane protease activity|nr:NfeD family protein [Prevotella sp.]
MKDFFSSMDATLQIYWYIAIIASVIFIIQTIMTFIGADSDTGMDADFDSNLDGGGHPFQLFSLRNLINFFLGFGWTGVSLFGQIESKFLLGVIAFVVGLIFIAVFFVVIKALMRLSEDNTFDIEETIGKTADVYMNIPASKSGKGKVFISIKGTTHELSAVTDSANDLKSGSIVKVLAIEGDVLVVLPLNK